MRNPKKSTIVLKKFPEAAKIERYQKLTFTGMLYFFVSYGMINTYMETWVGNHQTTGEGKYAEVCNGTGSGDYKFPLYYF